MGVGRSSSVKEPTWEVVLSFDGVDWVVRDGELTARGATLEALDDQLAAALRDSGRFGPGEQVSVFMGFDYGCMPTWLRQYAAHYFNRWVSLHL